MKPLATLVGAAIILAAAILFLVTGRAVSTSIRPALAPTRPTPAPSRSAMSVTIESVKPTTVTRKNTSVTFHLAVKGIVLDTAHMGKANVRGHGHIQLYVDRIPGDAYTRSDLKHWLASLPETTFALNLPPTLVGGPGKHRIIVALAQNDGVLYRAPVVGITITAK